MFILAQVNKWIIERHGIKVNNSSSFNINVIKGYPIIDFREPLLNFQYEVSMRMAEYKQMPELDKIVFGEDFYDMIERIKIQNKNLTLNKEQKEWWSKVDKLSEVLSPNYATAPKTEGFLNPQILEIL